MEEEFELSSEDRAAGVTFDGMVRLGANPQHAPVRLVRVQAKESELLLVTDKGRGELCALIYRYRWRIELFSNGSNASWVAATGWPRVSPGWRCRFTAP